MINIAATGMIHVKPADDLSGFQSFVWIYLLLLRSGISER